MYAPETSACISPAAEKRQSPIGEALTRLRSAESHLDAALDQLGSRLTSVLGQGVRNIAEGKDGPSEPSASQLHGDLADHARIVKEFAERVDSLAGRLTL